MSDIELKAIEEELRELLKRCSDNTLVSALQFRLNKDVDQIEPIVLGIIDRHLEPDQRDIFKKADDY